MPSNREMILPLYPYCRLGLNHDMKNIIFCGHRWLPVGARNMWHPRMYSEENGVIVCDEFSPEMINNGETQDSWLRVAGLERHELNRTKCLMCGNEGHIARHCNLLVNQMARAKAAMVKK